VRLCADTLAISKKMDSNNSAPTRLLKVLYDFTAEDDTEMTVTAGQVVRARGEYKTKLGPAHETKFHSLHQSSGCLCVPGTQSKVQRAGLVHIY
jgi:hypothetical protein